MFGLKEQDIDFYFIIQDHGLSLEEAIALKNSGSLPESLKKAWDEYDLWLDNLYKEDQRSSHQNNVKRFMKLI